MGSSCCKSDKTSKYRHSPSPEEINPKSKPKKSNSSTTSDPVAPIPGDKSSPPKDKSRATQLGEIVNNEKIKEDGNEIPNREGDSNSNEPQNRQSRTKSNPQTYDFPLKSQPKSTQNDPVERLKGNNLNRDIKGMTNPSALNTSMGYNDDFTKVPQNSIRVTFEEKPKKKADLFLDFNETQSKHYEDFMEKKPYKDTEPASKSQSNLMEWSKALQKLINQEKSSMNILENKNKLLKAYRAVLNFKERPWYEELAFLYKEKNGTKPNIMGLAFDRKTIQLQEQFKWFVGAVANTKLNISQTVGVHEFPPFKSSSRSRRADKFDSSNASFAKGGGSQTESDSYPPFDIQSPNKTVSNGHQPKKSLTTGLIFKPDQNDPRMNLLYEIPETTSSAWHYGFIWKGVYFRLFSKKEAGRIKKEVKALKYLAVEYFQTESTFRLYDTSHNANESIDTNYKHLSGQNINLILPLTCLVESPSWLLFATPVFPIKKSVTEDQASRLASEASNVFRSSYFLSTLNQNNFKIFNKIEDNTNPSQNTLANNQFLLIHNLSRSIIRLPRIDMLYAINQDSMAHVTYFDYPEKGLIDVDLIKKALGYHQHDIGTNFILKRDMKQETKSIYLESLRFKRRDWTIEMFFVSCNQNTVLPSTFTKNKRAMDLLSHSKKHKFREIKGNVLVFACLSNRNSAILPYFIADQIATQSMVEEILDPADLTITNKNIQMGPNTTKPKNKNYDSFQSGIGRLNREDKVFQDYFYTNLGKSIEQVIDTLESTDNILNCESLKELFHRRGVNMRYEWIVYSKIQNERAKNLIGCDILARCLKRIVNDKTHRKMKETRKFASLSLFEVKSKIDETLNEINDFMTESYARKVLCDYLNILVRSTSDSFEDELGFYSEIQSEVFFHRMRCFDGAKRFLNSYAFDNYMSAELVSQTINLSCLSANLFLDAIQHHFKVAINYDHLRQLRTDKYIHWVSAHGVPFKPTDLTMLYVPETFITVKERCFLLLLKTLPNYHSNMSEPIEFILPSSLYKLRKSSGFTESPGNTYDYLLKDYYELPDFEAINDWVVLIKGVLDGLYTPEGHQNFLIEAYLTQLTMLFFGDNDNENQLTSTILEQINTYVNTTPVCSPELLITIHTWFGLLSENKLFAECEQSYAVALLALHKLYGDPRGRGAYGTPWELFITWRLSILSRLQGKLHDAEYSEELFDATAMGLRPNPLNKHLNSHYIYNDPFREVYVGPYIKVPENLEHVINKPSFKKMTINDHPFTYWTNHLVMDENASKVDTINNTLQKSPQLLKWMINNLLIFQNTGILWDTAYLKDFILCIMQNSFSSTTSVSSISGLSVDRKGGSGGDGLSTPKTGTLRFEKKEKRSQGTLVSIFEKDSSTLNKKELNGAIYSWGQNHEGQVGTPISNVDDSDLISYQKKMKIYHPKNLVALKNTIILSVACGHTHSMAVTITRRVLAWGSNKSFQLGLGPKAPNMVYIPTIIPDFYDVAQISCGSEHTVALTTNEQVYSWGEGEGGLLGHGDTKTQKSPKMIDSLKKTQIQSIVCGGLHTIALTKQGHLFTWGRAEGGQLGLPYEQLVHDTEKGELYLPTPKRVRGLIEGVFINQIACGDAHSLALSQNGHVYAWGYTSSGQLGLGISGENSDPSMRCIKEPVLIEKLANVKITDIYAGYTFSIFISDKKEPYACGLNDYSQLGIEKTVLNVNDNKMNKNSFSNKYNEVVYPTKIDCFNKMPFLKLACGENHSVGLLLGEGVFMLFSWGIQKHAQLGLGDTQTQFSYPRPISYLQSVPIYSIGCGAYHSLVVVGEASKSFKKEALAARLDTRLDGRWCGVYFDAKDDYAGMFDTALSNLDNIVPAEEGKIDNPKSMNKA